MTIGGLFGCNGRRISIPNYLDKECYYGKGFQDYVDYCKYMYSEKDITEFKNNKYFKMVNVTDLATINEYFADFSTRIVNEDYSSHYDFNYKSQIKEGDYYCIISKEGQRIGDGAYGKFDSYDVYYFDTQKCILYYIHVNL